jgi:hypothetical protein
MKKTVTLLRAGVMLAALLCATMAFAQTDTIRLKDKRLLTSALKPGMKQYLVYFQMPAKKTTLNFWYWMRDIKTETRNGEKVFTISQHWYGADTSMYRTVYSVNRFTDFSPVYHKETVKGKTRAYNWNNDKITGADSVAINEAKTYSLNFKAPAFNWNLDIETFEMLPLAAGKTFAINFYDAGSRPDDYVIYKVIGSEVLTLLDNTKVDCWKLQTAGKSPNGANYTQTFWIGKKSHEFLKEEDDLGAMFRYKVKIGAAPDLLSRFK